MIGRFDAKIPPGPLAQKWRNHLDHSRLVSPHNRRKFEIIVVGSGLAGGSAAATLGELGYRVKCFCFQDSPRRAHSIAAQGGINAAKNYQNDGDSVYRLFYDTIKGGDFRSREANVYRLAEISNNIIDQCVAQGVPFAREYGGLLANRSFGGAQVSRTFYARGQTGQQLLLGCYQALCRQIAAGTVQMTHVEGFIPEYRYQNFFAFDKTVYFGAVQASPPSTGYELWRLDGSPAGARLVEDLNAGTADASPAYFVTYRGAFYFIASDANGRFLWRIRVASAEARRPGL